MFRWLLIPFSLLYGIVVWLRNKMFDISVLPSKEFNIPLIVVGNITVGGTGKTPHVEYLLKILQKDYKVAVLSRGYKRKKKGFIVASDESKSSEIGDEPRQIKRKFPEVGMAVNSSRVKGVEKLMKGAAGFDPDVLLLDDAYQHRYVKPGLSILLVDFNRPLEKDYLLPYGRLRESMYEKRRANIVIVTKTPKELKPIDRRIISKEMKLFPYQGLFFSYLKYGELTPVYAKEKDINFEELENEHYSVLLITGIANPIPLKEHIQEKISDIKHLNFSDHNNYGLKDIKKISKAFNKIENPKKIIVTTEKDAVRITDSVSFAEANLPVYYVPVEVGFLDEDRKNFEKRIFSYISNNKKSSSLNRTL